MPRYNVSLRHPRVVEEEMMGAVMEEEPLVAVE
jgi:hypothetical protein